MSLFVFNKFLRCTRVVKEAAFAGTIYAAFRFPFSGSLPLSK